MSIITNGNWLTKTAAYYVYSILNKINPYTSRMNLMNIYEDPGAKVIDNVYVGSLETGSNAEWISNNNISLIINLSGYAYQSTVDVVIVPLEDTHVYINDVEQYIDKFMHVAKIIKKHTDTKNNVLVHCAAGINRSVAAICFYLIMTGHSYENAIGVVMRANAERNVSTLTNISFRYLLRTYECCKRLEN
jgi:hypothetical protein